MGRESFLVFFCILLNHRPFYRIEKKIEIFYPSNFKYIQSHFSRDADCKKSIKFFFFLHFIHSFSPLFFHRHKTINGENLIQSTSDKRQISFRRLSTFWSRWLNSLVTCERILTKKPGNEAQFVISTSEIPWRI